MILTDSVVYHFVMFFAQLATVKMQRPETAGLADALLKVLDLLVAKRYVGESQHAYVMLV